MSVTTTQGAIDVSRRKPSKKTRHFRKWNVVLPTLERSTENEVVSISRVCGLSHKPLAIEALLW
jgi:hypothetical protein